MNQPTLLPYDWRIAPDHEHASFDRLISEIYPLREGIALMITNSFGGVPCDSWMLLIRFMVNLDDHIYTSMGLIDHASQLTVARDIARRYGWNEYGVDISTYDIPF